MSAVLKKEQQLQRTKDQKKKKIPRLYRKWCDGMSETYIYRRQHWESRNCRRNGVQNIFTAEQMESQKCYS